MPQELEKLAGEQDVIRWDQLLKRRIAMGWSAGQRPHQEARPTRKVNRMTWATKIVSFFLDIPMIGLLGTMYWSRHGTDQRSRVQAENQQAIRPLHQPPAT